MKSLQDYINIYRNIANNLNIGGDSAEILIQLLANATYINEVEQISYAREASLEKATLLNSKIQHCMNNMFSVYRGQCPRVILKFRPSKYFSLNMFDTIVTSNNFKIYYLGYYKGSTEKTGAIDEGFVYGPATISPVGDDDTSSNMIIGLLAKETVEKTWTTTSINPYSVTCLESGLSNDCWVKISERKENEGYIDVTREFSDHIKNGSVFDLTTTDFGSRLYLPEEYQKANVEVNAMWYKYSTLSEYNESELKKIIIKGTDPVEFEDEDGFNDTSSAVKLAKGLILFDSSLRDSIGSIHYKSSKDRFVNSLLRSNSDICSLLEDKFPENVISATYKFTVNDSGTNTLDIYYIPNSDHILSSEQIRKYKETNLSYYVSDNINIKSGTKYTAYFTLDYELYNNQSDIDLRKEIEDILKEYENKFNINFKDSNNELMSLISKISNIKLVNSINIIYKDNSGEQVNIDDIDLTTSYFNIVLNNN